MHTERHAVRHTESGGKKARQLESCASKKKKTEKKLSSWQDRQMES